MISATQVEWIPVVDSDGRHHTLTIRQALVQAHELRGFGAVNPIEQSTLIRLLGALGALVVREQGHRRPVFDAPAVDTVLERHAEKMYLDHPDMPFLQEWHVEKPSKDVGVQVATLAVGAPGMSSKSWSPRGALPNIWHPPEGLHTLLMGLATRWFHSFGGNSTQVHAGVRMSSGSVGARAGKDEVFYWRGSTLARTLMANTPAPWVDGKGLPAFLDRDATTFGTPASPHPLWETTNSLNGLLVRWDGEEPTSVLMGGSKMSTPAYCAVAIFDESDPDPAVQRKAAAELKARRNELEARMRMIDPGRVWLTDSKGKVRLFSGISPVAAPLVNLREWYQEVGSNAIKESKHRENGIITADLADPDDPWTVEIFSSETGGSQWPEYTRVDWFSYDPSTLDFDDEKADAIIASAGRVEKVLRSATSSTDELFPKRTGRQPMSPAQKSLNAKIAASFYRLASQSLRGVVASVKSGRDLDDALARQIVDAAYKSLVEHTELMLSPAMVPKVIVTRSRARSSLDRHIKQLVKPLKENA